MSAQTLIIPCRLSPEVFRSFALFDAFRRQKRWRAPVLFAVLFAAFAAVCFAMVGRVRHAGVLGGVLLAVGLIVPLGYVVSYLLSIQNSIKSLDLASRKVVYTLRLTGDGVEAEQGEQRVRWAWDDLAAAYRVEGCVYLYPSPRQAFLLPCQDQESLVEKAWAALGAHLPAEKLFDLRRGARPPRP